MAKKVKVPKKLIKMAKDVERVELRSGESSAWPYRIGVLEENGTYRNLGNILVKPIEAYSGGFWREKGFKVRFETDPKHSEYVEIKFGSRTSNKEAEKLAYESARRLAEKIANKNNVLLEDMIDEELLAMEIDSLPSRRGRLSIFTLSIIAGLALSLSSLSTTGYAVSNLTRTDQGLGGIFLFIMGLVGMFFSLRK